MNITLSTNIVTISKSLEQAENEDFPFHNCCDNEDYSIWVVCDGAGGSGVFCKEWAEHIAENIPIDPLEFECNYNNWFREVSESFKNPQTILLNNNNSFINLLETIRLTKPEIKLLYASSSLNT